MYSERARSSSDTTARVGAAQRLLKAVGGRVRQRFYSLYLHKLEAEMRRWRVPRHIGIIMDGNRRHARGHGARSVVEGHHEGADKLDEVLDWCEEVGVEVVTVWGFSLDNFARDAEEVSGLMSLFENKFIDIVTDERVHRDRIRVRSIGRTDLLPEPVQQAIAEAERATAHHARRVLNVGIAYGGREEILDALRSYLDAAAAAGQDLAAARDALDAEAIARRLYTAHVPDPDLIIRTSGEVRMSGFMLWQSVHSEFYFCDTHWPAFRKIDFLRALRSYDQRQRRYGR